MYVDRQLLTAIFNKWLSEHEEDPEAYEDFPGADPGYGERSADYFITLARTLGAKGEV